MYHRDQFVLGPILFSFYTTPLSYVIVNHLNISFDFYTDETQLYVHVTHQNEASAFKRPNNCLKDVSRWMTTNKFFKLFPDKTEFVVVGSKCLRLKLQRYFPVNILGTLAKPADILSSLSQDMSNPSASSALSTSGIFRDLGIISL